MQCATEHFDHIAKMQSKRTKQKQRKRSQFQLFSLLTVNVFGFFAWLWWWSSSLSSTVVLDLCKSINNNNSSNTNKRKCHTIHGENRIYIRNMKITRLKNLYIINDSETLLQTATFAFLQLPFVVNCTNITLEIKIVKDSCSLILCI